MGFDRARVDISCDVCGMESEPEDLSWSPALGGSYGLEEARAALRRDGWQVDESNRITCADCLADEDEDQHQGGGRG